MMWLSGRSRSCGCNFSCRIASSRPLATHLMMSACGGMPMDRLVIMSVWPDQERAHLIVGGTLDGWGAGELGRQVAGLVDAGTGHVMVDLSGVRGWDARGNHLINTTFRRLSVGGSLSVRGLWGRMLSGPNLLVAEKPEPASSGVVGSAAVDGIDARLVDAS